MKLGGIDGCKGGWILVKYYNENYELEMYENFLSLLSDNRQLDRVLIDIPIGLTSTGFKRTIESRMRAELQNRHPTVFNSPCRLAVYEKNDIKAKEINIKLENKSLSNQSLAIRKKIREVDEYLCEVNNRNNRTEIVESHPELCFKYLNKSIVQSNKTRTVGIKERLNIINNYEPRLLELYEKKQKEIRRKYAKRDDLIDTICLCLVNKLSVDNELSYLTDKNLVDDKGINVRIGFYQPELSKTSHNKG